MKNNKKMQNKYKRRRIVFVLIVILLIILFLGLLHRNNITRIASGENALNIGGETLDLSQVISNTENAPVVGAGMIPIKWDGEYWVITSTSDSDWYDYSKGKWANVMLSDGYYKSEPQPGINADEQVAEKQIGTPIQEDELGTIFTWIPRLAYSDEEVAFLKETSILEYMWTTESCFNVEKYGPTQQDIGFTGIWVGQDEFSDVTSLQNKITEMSIEENVQGLIANEAVTSLNDSEKIAVQKLQEKYTVTQNETMLQDIENMQYRQVIKIINVNNKLPIMATHEVIEGNIIVTAKYTENGIKYVTDKDGNEISNGSYPLNEEEIHYTFYLVDNIGNIRRYKMNYGAGTPYLKGFNKSTTFYVTYEEDDEGNIKENSSIPIGETAPYDWYNYDNRQWANIVVRNNGNEAYYTWIPRYMYTLDSETQTSSVKFVDLDNCWTDTETGKLTDLDGTEYILPEAFTWEDPENPNNVTQLTGFWVNKYKLRASTTYEPSIYGLGGTIAVDGVVAALGDTYEYEMYLINSEGKRIAKNEETGEYEENPNSYIDLDESINSKGNYRYTGLDAGTYTVNIIVKDSTGKHIRAVANVVNVLEKIPEEPPRLGKYNEDLTYYVMYDKDGNETSNIPIGEYSNIKIGEDEVTGGPDGWYDYDAEEYATIVVRDDGTEKYYEWIPRYQYQTSDSSRIMYIKEDKIEADAGYTIHPNFITKDENGNDVHLPGYWREKENGNYSNRLVANVTASEDEIKINNIVCTTADVTYEISLIHNGERTTTEDLLNGAHIFDKEDGLEEGKIYAINIIAYVEVDSKKVMVSAYSKQVVLTKINIDLTGFNVANTFYVTYDENGKEDSSVPIGETQPEGWYDYTTQQWANIVVRNNGNEAYYTWIPRYQYKLDTANQKSIVQFISKDIEEPTSGYKIPEAFMWEDETEDDGLKDLDGFWVNKYKLRASSTYTPAIYGLGGTVAVDGVVAAIGQDYEYELYLINENGQRIVKGENGYELGTALIDLDEKINSNGNYRFTGVPEGNYTVNVIVKDENGNHISGIANQVIVLGKTPVEVPDLSSYEPDLTYYVMYDEDENETSNIPIGEYMETESRGPDGWYDYDAEVRATIVVRDDGTEKYYEWIPRYQCQISDSSRIMYIKQNKTTPDDGYTIPDKFTGKDEEGNPVPLTGYWQEVENASYSNRLVATVTASEDEIRVSNIVCTTSDVTYEISLICGGKEIKTEDLVNGEHVFNKEDGLVEGKYAINIIAKNAEGKMVSGYAKQVVLAKVEVDLTGFNPSTTFYVTYNDSGEESYIPIGETEPEGWYDYTQQKWANIVVRNNGNEAYYTWIPRYQYKLDTANQKSSVQFISTNITEPSSGYTIPEAFMWENETAEGGIEHLKGFWVNKYKLRATSSYVPDIYGLGGIIAVDGVIEQLNNTLGEDTYECEMYLINSDGKRIVKSATTGKYEENPNDYINLKTAINTDGNYRFSGLDAGEYTVNIIVKQDGKHIMAIANYVEVLGAEQIEPPVLSELEGYNKNLTYFVEYTTLAGDTAVREESNVPTGNMDNAPENWYDYTQDKEATIVVRDTGTETYYEWIPRYQYETANESRITYISENKTDADPGYTIHPNFITKDENGNTVHLPGYWKEVESYPLSSSRIMATVASEGNKIRVSNVTSTGTEKQYNVYLIKNGEIIGSPKTVTGDGSCEFTITDDITGTGVKYAVLVEQINTIAGTVAGYAKEVRAVELAPPDVTGFTVNTTYIVTYDESGNETKQKLADVLVAGYTTTGGDNPALISGTIDLTKINGTWYDYTEQKWANIVTENNDKVAYFTWIPRYEYKLNSEEEIANVILISTEQAEADEGYTIPEAFTWEDPTAADGLRQLSGFWVNKYKLRN